MRHTRRKEMKQAPTSRWEDPAKVGLAAARIGIEAGALAAMIKGAAIAAVGLAIAGRAIAWYEARREATRDEIRGDPSEVVISVS